MTADLRTRLESSQKQLFQAIQGFTEEQFHTRPDGESWCASEVLMHLLASEQRMRDRVRLALGQSGGAPPALSEAERRAEAEAGREAPVPQLVHGLLGARRETSMLIESLRPEDLSRPASHPDLGTISVERMLQRIVEHEQEHIEQIESIKRLLKVEKQQPV
jgi:uncharacterized damage-inducible protein DinB